MHTFLNKNVQCYTQKEHVNVVIYSNIIIINPDSMLLLLLTLLLLTHEAPNSTHKKETHKCNSRSKENRTKYGHGGGNSRVNC
jgi:hypothetical protein